MKTRIFGLLFLLIACFSGIFAQDQPFVFTASGGLFFPSNTSFRNISQSESDLIYGVGIGLPLRASLLVTADVSFFQSKALADPAIDSSVTLQERFVHVGLLKKEKLSSSFYLRLSGGLNYSTVREKLSSPGSGEVTHDADKKIGYYGGLGIEQPLDEEQRFFLFLDCIYDYRRSANKDLYGDFGGLRIVLGVNLYMF